jgi:outer membrane protein assembly factor BamB
VVTILCRIYDIFIVQGGQSLTQRRRIVGAAVALLLLSVVLSGCGSTPVAQDWPGLAVADGIVYVTSGLPQKIYSVDAKTGVQKSMPFVPQPEPRGTFYWSPVTLAGGVAFVGFGVLESKAYGLYAFDPLTSTEQWHIAAQNLVLAAPVYAGGVVYYGSSDGLLYAVDVETRSPKAGWPFNAHDAIWGSPLVANGRVYAASLDHQVYCLDAETGKLIWQFEAEGAMASQPALDATRGVLYIGDFAGKVYALQVDTGKPVEGFAFSAKNWIWSDVLVAEDRLYVTSLDGNLYALDSSSGAVIPPYPFDGGDAIRAAPVRSGDLILIASSEGKLTAVDGPSGVQQWQWPKAPALPAGGILSTPVVADGVVYVVVTVAGQPSTVYALQVDTGDQAPGNWPSPPPPAQ